jgi:alcohol dehydrogenase class IV
MSFEFATATRIIFGRGTSQQVAPAARHLGSRVQLVTGKSRANSDRIEAELTAAGVSSCRFEFAGEPTIDIVSRGVEFARAEKCDVVVAVGGGSVIDAGKAIAGLMMNPGEVLDYLEVVGKGQALRNPAVPFIAVPTTAGTGSEVTRNAVLAVPARKVKASLRSPYLLPHLAVVDPDLTLGLPPPVTSRTGLDALTQLIEAYVSIRANPITDGFCLQGIPLVARSLRQAFHHGDDAAARTDMSLAALLSGLALANAGLGVIHGFAAPIGGRFDAPHGTVCAAILPHGMEINLRALRRRDSPGNALGSSIAPSGALRRYQDVGRLLTGNPAAGAEDGVVWVREIVHELAIPPLRAYGVDDKDVPILVDEAARASSTKANPVALTSEELTEVLACSLN